MRTVRVGFLAVLTSVLTLNSITSGAATSSVGIAMGVGPGACSLLDDPEFLAAISGAGESSLRSRCNSTLAATGSTPSPRRVVAGPATDRLVNDRSTDTYPHITQSETTVAVSGSTVLVGYNDSGEFALNRNFTGYSRSLDGGANWTDMGTLTVPLGDVANVFGDPVAVADRTRTAAQTAVFYFSNLAADSSGRSIISVHTTADGGGTWVSAANASPLAAGDEFQDKEWLAVDTSARGAGAGNVYVCWRRFGGGGGIQFSRSTDGAATFSQLSESLSSNPRNVQGCSIAVNPVNGHVYVAWLNAASALPTIRLRRSTDFGTTFGPELTIGTADIAEEIISCAVSGFRTVFLDKEAGAPTRAIRSIPFPSLAVNPKTEDVYVAWHRGNLPGGSSADIAFSRSLDDGQTFSAPARINSQVAGHQFFASIAANAQGQVAATYYSTQNSATDRLLDLYEVRSGDGGDTWSAPIRVTDVSFDRPMTNPNFDFFVANCYMGDYNTVSTAAPHLGDAGFYMAWGDNRLDGNLDLIRLQPDPDVRFDRN
jgi:hypothetical protein